MRLFIAVRLSEDIKTEIEKVQSAIRINDFSLPKKENTHITLKFLGEIDNYAKIAERLEKVEFKQFSIKTAEIGFFPNEAHARVVWLGFKEDEALKNLQKNIDNALYPEFAKENDFVTHATIARIKLLSEPVKNALKRTKSLRIPEQTCKVSSFFLYKSTLTSQGPIYEPLAEFPGKAL